VGQCGFNAPIYAAIASRQQLWTYNAQGQVPSGRGPRTDDYDSTTYQYYTATTADHRVGDLRQLTYAAGQTTRFLTYNLQGQPMRMVDHHGVVTARANDLCQRLTTVTVVGLSTVYTWAPTGLLSQVTQPDGSSIGFEYDDAHRQTAVKDNLGNRIDYTLDNACKRTAEAVKDAVGMLRRQLQRSIDALGRVQQVLGRTE